MSESNSIPPYLDRMVTDGSDRAAWFQARSLGITATDVAKLSTPRSIYTAALNKLIGSGFHGNAYTEYGKTREPIIADWMLQQFGIPASSALFHAAEDTRHLATPDGLLWSNNAITLAEIKTTNKSWRTIPRNYLRQIWWQQYVLGAERTLLIWEEHQDFIPQGEPQARWVERDDTEIKRLLDLAAKLMAEIEARGGFGPG